MVVVEVNIKLLNVYRTYKYDFLCVCIMYKL